MMLDTQDMVVEILVVAKFMREMHLERQSLVIQRCFRKWESKEVPPIRRVRRAIVVLQSHYRRRKTAVQVDHWRRKQGIRLKRFVHAPAVLYPDARGLLTRARDVSIDDNVEALSPPLSLMTLVHLPGMSSAQRDDLGFAVSPIQAMVKYQSFARKIKDIQRIWRGHVARRNLQRKRRRAIQIQTVWRAKIARNGLRRARAAAIKIQAHKRRILAARARRDQLEEQLAEVFAAVMEMGDDEVVNGRRIRAGGSVSN